MNIREEYKNLNEENMKITLLWVLNNIHLSITGILSNLWGVLLTIGVFLGALLAPVGIILCLTFGLVFLDFLFGVRVSIKNKGIGAIESNKAKNSLVKLFFYWLFILIAFVIESGLGIDICFGPKVMFGIVGAVELWSIVANGMILHPNIPIFKLFQALFTSEISKKLDIPKEDVKEILKQDIKHRENKDK